jgi:acyl carrier protein
MPDISRKIRSLIAAHFDVEEDCVKPDAALVADLGANSLDLVEITLGLEQEFDLTISDAVAEEFRTVGDVESYLRSALE